MNESNPELTNKICFGRFCIDRDARELLRDNCPQEIEPKSLELLELLASQPGHTFSKDQLAESIWPGRVISDSVISQAIRKIRKVTDDSPTNPKVIKTIHGVGYRFVAKLNHQPRHQVRAPYQRWQFGLFGLLAMALVLAVTLNIDRQSGPSQTGVTAALLPFVNATGDDQLDWVTTGLPGLLAAGLNSHGQLGLVDNEQVEALQRNFSTTNEPERADIDRLRDMLGADLLVSGRVQGQADSWQLVLRIDQPNGETIEQVVSSARLAELVTGQAYQVIRQTISPAERVSAEPFSSDSFVNETFARGLASEQGGDNLSARDLYAVVIRLDPDYLPGWLALARVQQLMGELEQSAATLADLFGRSGRTEALTPRLLVEVKQIEGLIAFGSGDNQSARDHLEEALKLSREHQLALSEGTLLRYLGMVANREGLYEIAESHYAQALAIFDRENYEPGRARAFNSLGTLAWRRDMITESEHWHRRALASFQRLGARDLEHVTLSNLAVIAANRGQIEQSLMLNQQVLAHHRSSGNRESEIVVLGNTARALSQLNQLSAAEAAATEMLDLAAELGIASQIAYAQLQLGLIKLRMAETRRALTHLALAHESYVALADEPFLTSVTVHMIRAHLLDDDAESARAFHARHVSLLDQANSPSVQSQVLWVRSMLAVTEGQIDASIEQLEQARALARQSGQVEAANTYTTELADLLLRAGRVDDAEPLLAQIDSFNDRFIPSLLTQARLDYERGHYSKAIETMERARERAGEAWVEKFDARLDTFRMAMAQGQRLALGDELL